MAVPVTDQAIAKIKDLIISGEFVAGAKLPREQDLAARLGLSRNSLREAVRALALIGVLDTRVGDGTYVTSLDADVLLTGMGFVGDLLEGKTLLEVHQVRRILEPVATGLAATRLTEQDFVALEACLSQMEVASMNQAFIDADTEFEAKLRALKDAAGIPPEESKQYEFVLTDALDTLDSSSVDHRKLMADQEDAAKHRKKSSSAQPGGRSE